MIEGMAAPFTQSNNSTLPYLLVFTDLSGVSQLSSKKCYYQVIVVDTTPLTIFYIYFSFHLGGSRA